MSNPVPSMREVCDYLEGRLKKRGWVPSEVLRREAPWGQMIMTGALRFLTLSGKTEQKQQDGAFYYRWRGGLQAVPNPGDEATQ